MPDLTYLPDGRLILVNGAQVGELRSHAPCPHACSLAARLQCQHCCCLQASMQVASFLQPRMGNHTTGDNSRGCGYAGIAGGTGPNYSAANYGTTTAEIYDPTKPLGQRWSPVADAQIWRLYHSVSFLTQNATVLPTCCLHLSVDAPF